MVTYIKKSKFFVNLLSILFCLKYLSLGMRVAILEVLFVYLLTSNLKNISIKKMIIGGSGTLILMNIFAIYRSGRNALNWDFILLDLNLANAGFVCVIAVPAF